jgi:hypothetical protein
MLVNRTEKSILTLEKNKNNCYLFPTCTNPNYSRAGKVTVIENGRKNGQDLCQLFHPAFGEKKLWHKNLSETVRGEKICVLNSFLASP